MPLKLNWIVKVTEGRISFHADVERRIEGVSIDTRTIQPNQLYIPLRGDRFDGHHFYQQAIDKGAGVLLWQEDHPLPEKSPIPIILVKDTLEALQQLAKAYRKELPCRVIAVTGSNGKTTTKDLIASVLATKYRVQKTQGNLNNHIGVPLTILSLSMETEIAVIEMGMNHKGEISLLSQIAAPEVSVITNIGESHIEYLGSRAGIADAKLEIMDGLAKEGCLFYDGDEPLLKERLNQLDIKNEGVTWDFITHSESLDFSGWRFTLLGIDYPFYLPLLGRHNLKNALLSIRVAQYLGCDAIEIGTGLASARGSENRLELVTAANGMQIINDTYNASPTSMKAGLELLHELKPELEKWALLGDIFEIGEREKKYLQAIGIFAVQHGLTRLYTTGEKGRLIAEGALQANQNHNCLIKHISSFDQIVELIHREGNEHVLLLVKASRAASLDQVVKKLVEGV